MTKEQIKNIILMSMPQYFETHDAIRTLCGDPVKHLFDMALIDLEAEGKLISGYIQNSDIKVYRIKDIARPYHDFLRFEKK